MLQKFGLPVLNRRQWRAVFINVALEITNEYGTLVSTVTLPAILHSLDISVDELAIVKSITKLVGVLGIVWALLTDVYGRKLFFQIGIPLAAINQIFGGIVWNASSMIIVGVIRCLTPDAPAAIYLIEEIGPDRRGAIVSLLAVSAGAGAAIALGLWALIGNYSWGWRVILILKSLPLMYISFMMFCSREEFIPESFCFARPRQEGLAAFKRPIRSLFFNSSNLKVLLIWSFYNFVNDLLTVTLGQFIFIHLSNYCEYNAQTTSLLTIIGGVFAMPLVYLTGLFSDSYGRVRTAQIIWILSSVSYYLFYSSPCNSFRLPIGFIMVITFPQFCNGALTNVVNNELWKTEHRALAQSVINVVNAISGAIGFYAYPYVRDYYGHMENAEIFLAILSGIVLPLIWFFIPESNGIVMNNLNQDNKDHNSKEIILLPKESYGSVNS